MAVFSAIAAGIGSALSAVGTGISSALGLGGSAAGAAGAAGAAAGGSSALAGLSGLAGIVGTGVSVVGQFQQQAAMKKAEQIRSRQMSLEAMRAQRQALREAQIARAAALSNATAQGAGGGSGIQGGMAQIAGQQNTNILGINQGLSLGQGMFAANRQLAAGQTMSSIGSGIQNFGSFLAQNQQTMNRLYPSIA